MPARDVAYVQGNAIAAWAWIAGEGPTVYQATVSPSTDSTDGWATVAGQTPRVSLPYRQAFNEWLRDGAPLNGAEPVAAGGAGIPADGRYGPITEAAAKRVQRENGLTVDGKIGPDTWRAVWADR